MGVAILTTGVLAWGTLAFGGGYPWARGPLALACAGVGLYGLVATRRDGPLRNVWLWLGLGTLVAACLVQLIPLPQSVLTSVSPSTDRLLREHDLQYAVASQVAGRVAGPLQIDPPAHSLSIDPDRTIVGAALLSALTIFLMGLVRLFGRGGVSRAVVGIVGLGSVVAIIGIVQKSLLGDDAFSGMRIYGLWEPENLLTTPFGPFTNKNHFAGWMVMVLPLTLGYLMARLDRSARRGRSTVRDWLVWLSTPSGGPVLIVLFATIVMGTSLAMTASRSGIGAFGLATAVLVLVVVRTFRPGRGRRITVAALLTVLLLSLGWAGSAVVVQRFGETPESMQLRLAAWADATRMARDFPLTGTGLNTYGTASIFYSSGDVGLHFQEAHNDYLQIIAEGGLLLVAPVALVIGLFVRSVRHAFLDDRSRRVSSWVRVGAVTGIMAIALQSFVEFSLQMPGNAAMFTVLAAIAIRRPPSPVRSAGAPGHQ